MIDFDRLKTAVGLSTDDALSVTEKVNIVRDFWGCNSPRIPNKEVFVLKWLIYQIKNNVLVRDLYMLLKDVVYSMGASNRDRMYGSLTVIRNFQFEDIICKISDCCAETTEIFNIMFEIYEHVYENMGIDIFTRIQISKFPEVINAVLSYERQKDLDNRFSVFLISSYSHIVSGGKDASKAVETLMDKELSRILFIFEYFVSVQNTDVICTIEDILRKIVFGVGNIGKFGEFFAEIIKGKGDADLSLYVSPIAGKPTGTNTRIKTFFANVGSLPNDESLGRDVNYCKHLLCFLVREYIYIPDISSDYKILFSLLVCKSVLESCLRTSHKIGIIGNIFGYITSNKIYFLGGLSLSSFIAGELKNIMRFVMEMSFCDEELSLEDRETLWLGCVNLDYQFVQKLGFVEQILRFLLSEDVISVSHANIFRCINTQLVMSNELSILVREMLEHMKCHCFLFPNIIIEEESQTLLFGDIYSISYFDLKSILTEITGFLLEFIDYVVGVQSDILEDEEPLLDTGLLILRILCTVLDRIGDKVSREDFHEIMGGLNESFGKLLHIVSGEGENHVLAKIIIINMYGDLYKHLKDSNVFKDVVQYCENQLDIIDRVDDKNVLGMNLLCSMFNILSLDSGSRHEYMAISKRYMETQECQVLTFFVVLFNFHVFMEEASSEEIERFISYIFKYEENEYIKSVLTEVFSLCTVIENTRFSKILNIYVRQNKLFGGKVFRILEIFKIYYFDKETIDAVIESMGVVHDPLIWTRKIVEDQKFCMFLSQEQILSLVSIMVQNCSFQCNNTHAVESLSFVISKLIHSLDSSNIMRVFSHTRPNHNSLSYRIMVEEISKSRMDVEDTQFLKEHLYETVGCDRSLLTYFLKILCLSSIENIEVSAIRSYITVKPTHRDDFTNYFYYKCWKQSSKRKQIQSEFHENHFRLVCENGIICKELLLSWSYLDIDNAIRILLNIDDFEENNLEYVYMIISDVKLQDFGFICYITEFVGRRLNFLCHKDVVSIVRIVQKLVLCNGDKICPHFNSINLMFINFIYILEKTKESLQIIEDMLLSVVSMMKTNTSAIRFSVVINLIDNTIRRVIETSTAYSLRISSRLLMCIEIFSGFEHIKKHQLELSYVIRNYFELVSSLSDDATSVHVKHEFNQFINNILLLTQEETVELVLKSLDNNYSQEQFKSFYEDFQTLYRIDRN